MEPASIPNIRTWLSDNPSTVITVVVAALLFCLGRFLSRPRIKIRVRVVSSRAFIQVTQKGDGETEVLRAVSFQTDAYVLGREEMVLLGVDYGQYVVAEIYQGKAPRVLKRGNRIDLRVKEGHIHPLVRHIIVQGDRGLDIKALSRWQLWRLRYWEARQREGLPWWHLWGLLAR